jgi:hypothetical protein
MEKPTLDRFLKIDSKRVFLFIIFLLAFIITEIGRKVYRPYIYSNNIFDFWIADTIGNFTGTIAIIFFDLAIINILPEKSKDGKWYILFITIGLIIYELVQYILPGRNTCDFRDIIATIIAGLISLGLYKLIYSEKFDPGRELFSQGYKVSSDDRN